MQQCIVDPFSKKAVTALLHHGRIAAKRLSCGGKGFCRHFSLSANMCRRGGCPVLDVSQISFAPEFPAHFIGLYSVLKKFSRKTPVAVILKPNAKNVFIAYL